MKQKLSLLTSAAVVAVASQASAQGLLSIGQNLDADFERKTPLTWIVGAQVGWDSNPGLYNSDEHDSGTISASVEARYATMDRRSALNFHASYSPLWYMDAPPNRSDFEQGARVGFDYRRRINPKLTITNSFYAAYEVEPDYQIGATIAQNTEQYFYGHNSTAFAYAWNRRFSTVTSYTIHGVWYEGDGDDYLTNIFANEFRYAMNRTTTAAFTYRYALSDFDISDDYDSHYVLGGVDHIFDPRLIGSARIGAEFREGDSTPYFEGSLTYRVTKKTDLRWYANYGYSTNGTDSGTESHFRSGLTASHRFNSRFTGSMGIHYVPQGEDYNEQDVIAASAGFNYVLFRNVSLNGGYNYTSSTSDNDYLEYDRHQIQLGIASQF